MWDKTIAVNKCQVCVLGNLEKALPLHSSSNTKHCNYTDAGKQAEDITAQQTGAGVKSLWLRQVFISW